MCDNCAEARKVADNISEQMKTSERVREFYRRQGECREQERIIKLLQEMRDACLSVTSKIGDHNAWTLENAIALIKEENK